jgi:DNA-binding transcriptional regulator YiaG
MNTKNLIEYYLLDADRLPANKLDGVDKNSSHPTMAEIEFIIGLIKKGNASSLAKVRRILEVTVSEFSTIMGIPENTLISWEIETDTPPHKSLIIWRIKLGDFIEGKISRYLRTTNPELIHQFWDIMWRLND